MEIQERFIAFVDVLGFKELVAQESLPEVMKLYEKMMAVKEEAIQVVTEKVFRVGTLPAAKINSVAFSDSIILWTNGSSWYNFVQLLLSLQYIFANAVEEGYLLRGSLTFGEFLLALLNRKIKILYCWEKH
jgi:hypothetical protein